MFNEKPFESTRTHFYLIKKTKLKAI